MRKKNEISSIIGDTVKKHIVLSAALVLTVAGAVISSILPPLILERIINVLAVRSMPSFSLAAAYAALLAVAGLFDAAKESLITVFGQKVTHNLRSALCAKLSRLPASYYTNQEPGAVVSRFVNDVDTVETLFTSGVISMAADICKVGSIGVVIFSKSKGLGCLLLAVTPALFALIRTFQKRMFAAQSANRAAVGRVNNHIPETIQNIRMIHTFRKERFMERRYDSLIGESYRHVEKSNFYDAVYSPIIITSSAVLVAVMMILSASGGQMQMWFGMSVGTAVAVISYVGKVFEPLESIGMEIQNIQSAAAGIGRIREFLQEPEREMPHPQKSEASVLERSSVSAVELSHVSFGYGKEKEILHDYSMDVKSGENVTLIGRTGAGKSTIFKLLLGLYQPWGGTVFIFGTEASAIPDVQKRKLFGYVEQSFPLIPGTVLEQITLKDPAVSQQDAERALRLAGMEETVRQLPKGYDTPCTAELFSQGQFQLLSIARAVAADPAILLLDEMTANLDSATEQKVLAALKAASKNRTVLSISHRLYEPGIGRKVSIS